VLGGRRKITGKMHAYILIKPPAKWKNTARRDFLEATLLYSRVQISTLEYNRSVGVVIFRFTDSLNNELSIISLPLCYFHILADLKQIGMGERNMVEFTPALMVGFRQPFCLSLSCPFICSESDKIGQLKVLRLEYSLTMTLKVDRCSGQPQPSRNVFVVVLKRLC
jgi:hypothetical protein